MTQRNQHRSDCQFGFGRGHHPERLVRPFGVAEISNPPFGVDWKKVEGEIRNEHKPKAFLAPVVFVRPGERPSADIVRCVPEAMVMATPSDGEGADHAMHDDQHPPQGQGYSGTLL